MINAASAFGRGFEGELDWRLRSNLNTVLGYTCADSVVTPNIEDPASVGVQQPGLPKNKATVGVDWTAFRRTQVSPHLSYLSRTTSDSDNFHHTDPHFIADLAVTMPIKKGVKAFIPVENLLNLTYLGLMTASPLHCMASRSLLSQVSG